MTSCVFVASMFIIGIMYGIDLLDTSEGINSGCLYGWFSIVLPAAIFISIMLLIHICQQDKKSSSIAISFETGECVSFSMYTFMKLAVITLNICWFSRERNFDGECHDQKITRGAYYVSFIVTVYQWLLLIIPYLRRKLQTSFIAYCLLVAINFGFIWFDLSVEVLHLKHFIKNEHLDPKWLFYWIQGLYWVGLEFHVTLVEILIRGWIESRHKEQAEISNQAALPLTTITRKEPNNTSNEDSALPNV